MEGGQNMVVLTVAQAAERACVSNSLVYEWCKTGVLKHARYGRPGRRGTIRIGEEDLTAFLAGCQHKAHSSVGIPALKHISLG
jgi:excisionase family DNA binding protein